jgi:cyclopropane-fatty-acyl-phospholipid synthase
LHAPIARAITARAVRGLPLTLAFPDGSTWGAGGPRLELTDPDAFFARLGRDGLIGFGEAWMTGALTAGGWRPGSRPGSGETDVRVLNESTDELAAALTVLATRMAALVPRPLQRLRSGWQHRPPAAEANTPDGARENIHRHYDLSNEMFELFLDPSLTYSAALYPDPELAGLTAVPDPDAGLAEAQLAKIDSVLDLAGVRAGMQVIEIGSGWGALAIRAAQRGAEVTTLTLSIEQQDLARKRVAQAGLTDRIDVRLEDYRTHAADHRGNYDAAVSVEMIEAVGEEYWPAYFGAVDQMLRPGGRFGLQTITIDHDRLLATRRVHTWIHKYIFPGGQLPSLPAIDDVLLRHTAMRVLAARRLGHSYVRTLSTWRHRFNERASDAAALGFDETFRRMWTFYLAYSQAGFAADYLDDWQLGIGRDGTAPAGVVAS